MKYIKYIILTLLLIRQTLGCTIVDPTYDFSFKTLFGSDGQSLYDVKPKDRLIALLTSILQPMFQIKVLDLKYENSESKSGNTKDLLFDIMVSCKCQQTNKALPYLIDLEIQRAKTSNFVARTIMYGNRLANQASRHATSYDEQPKNIVISIIDDVLNDYPNDIVFYVGPCFKTVYSLDNGTTDGTLTYNSPLQVFIQLPLLCQAIKDKISNEYTQNEWLKLLGSRRIYEGINVKYTVSGTYQLKEADFNDTTVKNSVQVLQLLNDDISNYNFTIESQNRKLEDENANKIQLEKKELEIKEMKIENEKLIMQDILKRDIKKYKKYTKPVKCNEVNSYTFAKRLKGKDKKYLESLLSNKQKKSVSVQQYLESISKPNSIFDEKSMEEESFE